MRFESTFIAATREFADYDKIVPAPYMRAAFTLNKAPQSARISITALGFYDLYVNGTRITKGILAPYISNPDQVVVYDLYDVAPLLQKGKNVIGLLLGNGFSNNFGGISWDLEKAPFRAAPKTAFRVEADGKEVFSTASGKVKCAPSPILWDDYREGEKYDATKEIAGWNLPDFDDAAWKDAIPAAEPKGRKVCADFEPIREYKLRTAVRVIPLEDGFLYDFGVNTAGVPVLKIDGRKGQKVTLICGEWFKDGNMDTKNIQCWVRYRRRSEEIQTIEYTCKGERGEGFTPCFSYYGCRYVKVTGIDASQATPDLVAFSEQSSALKRTGWFTCSDRYANETFRNTVRSDYSNFFYFPTDCPHREKQGWTADAALSSEQFAYVFDCRASLRRWLACVRDCQKESGAIPCVVPTDGWGYGWGSGPSWDAVLTVVPHTLYKYFGDRAVLEENADAIWKYLGFLRGLRKENGTIEYGLGDWCQIGAIRDSDPWTPVAVTDTCNALDICAKAAEIFSVLGQQERAAAADALKGEFREAIRANFVEWWYGDAHFCRPYCLTQTAQALFIRNGIFTEEELPHAVLRLKEMLGGTVNQMQVGVIGLPALLWALTDNGLADLAYETAMSPDRPSYGNMIDHGATSLWEFIHTFVSGGGYDVLVGKIKSMNHHFWGSIAAWYMRGIAGIRPDFFAGENRIDVAPHFVKQLSCADARWLAPSGEVRSSWQRLGEDKILMFVNLPEGAHGELIAPRGWRSSERELSGGKKIILTRE